MGWGKIAGKKGLLDWTWIFERWLKKKSVKLAPDFAPACETRERKHCSLLWQMSSCLVQGGFPLSYNELCRGNRDPRGDFSFPSLQDSITICCCRTPAQPLFFFFYISGAVLTFLWGSPPTVCACVCSPLCLTATLWKLMDADLNKSVICGHTNDKWHYRQGPPCDPNAHRLPIPKHLKRLVWGWLAWGWTERTALEDTLVLSAYSIFIDNTLQGPNKSSGCQPHKGTSPTLLGW